MKNSLGFRNLSDSDVTSYSSAASLSGKILVNRRSGNKWHKIFTLISFLSNTLFQDDDDDISFGITMGRSENSA